MRGALRARIQCALRVWIIPADAGSTGGKILVGGAKADHPRGCGEHRMNSASPSSHWGSSPRMRGALWCIGRAASPGGIIPADAGSTSG